MTQLDCAQWTWLGGLVFLLGLALFFAGFNLGAWYQGWLLNKALAKARSPEEPRR
jgi:hypothetical protein